MTRKEEIIAEAKKHEYDWGVDVDRFDVPDIFAKGAEWADKTMIKKACEWITEHINIPYEGELIDDSPVASDYIEWCEKRLEYAKAIADAFKQAMEE